jgi:hypothetical protein
MSPYLLLARPIPQSEIPIGCRFAKRDFAPETQADGNSIP